MPRIKHLPPHEIHKIAAGEVVDRPANVVKELIENALDAGSTQITIIIKDGGKELIQVIDNGYGMSADDARLSIEHHATSKITSVDDLKTVQTFGFRGEALSSICAVSRVTLCTKEEAALHGTRIAIDAGTITQESPTSSNTGTDIAISDLFYNVPARRKFLKKRETEFNAIAHLVQALCLLHTSIHFKLIHDGTVLLHCPPADSIATRFAQVFDHSWNHHILSIESTSHDITVSGAISNHQYHRYDRSCIFFYVNNRWVKNYTLSRALLKGYMNVLPANKFPASCINITINPELVDINIHPRKEEVQFINPRIVENIISQSIKECLESNLSAQLKKPVQFASAIPQPSYYSAMPPLPVRSIPRVELSYTFDKPVFVERNQESIADTQHHISEQFQEPVLHDTQTAVTPESPLFTIIGQYNKTYILLEQEEGLFLVDQHAAHERILYELFAQRFHDVATVALLFPQIITITAHELVTLLPHLPIFEQNGIGIEQFSDNQLIIQSTPVHLKEQSCQELIKQVIGWIQEHQTLETTLFTKTIHEKLRAQMACKAAVKAGDVLSREKMEQLLTDLHKTDNRLTCPHGRPTGWLLSLHEIEKKFKRKL